MSGPELALRMVRDRGQLWIDVTPSGGNYCWKPADKILQEIGIIFQHDPDGDLTSLAGVLADNSEQIEKLIQEKKGSWPPPLVRPPF